jgi:uncharacterized protein YqjF (DUF2071 family)
MECEGGVVRFVSERVNEPAARIEMRTRPARATRMALPPSLEHFLIERYCVFSLDGDGRLLRSEIHHRPWMLRSCQCDVLENGLVAAELGAAGRLVDPLHPDLTQFAPRQDVTTWLPRTVERP